jgi:peptide/nickel transport system permease protein
MSALDHAAAPAGARSAAAEALRRTAAEARRRPLVALAMAGIVLFVVCAVFGDRIAPFSAYDQDIINRLQPPGFGGGHWLGTDELGRDILSRLIVGARATGIVAAACILIGGILGGAAGIVAGFKGGRLDTLIMRTADATLSLPALLLALIFAVANGPGIGPVVATISILIWARFARVVRSAAMGVRHRDWIKQARVNGCGDLLIMLRHVVPHVLDVWLVVATLQIGNVVLLESSLGFLGVGIPPPQPSWGEMTATGREYLGEAWWIAIFPALALTLVIVAFNIVGDWLRDWLDPRAEQG